MKWKSWWTGTRREGWGGGVGGRGQGGEVEGKEVNEVDEGDAGTEDEIMDAEWF